MVEERKAQAERGKRRPAAAYAGRLYPSLALCVGRVKDGALQQEIGGFWKTLPPLSGPKPTASEFYLESLPQRGSYVRWDQANPATARLRGRKFYRHSKPTFLDGKDIDKTNQNVTAQLLPDGVVFEFSMRFENLSAWELGALAWCLTPEDHGLQIRHKIGMGKPVGLGSCKVEILWDSPDNETAVEKPWQWSQLIDSAARYRSFVQTGRLYGEEARSRVDSLRDVWRKNQHDSPGSHLGELLALLRWPPGETVLVAYPSLDMTGGNAGEEEGFRWFRENQRSHGPTRVLPMPTEENEGKRLTSPP